MEQLPVEIVETILRGLPINDLLSCALSSKKLLQVACRVVPELASLRICLSDCPCPCSAGGDANDAWLKMCMCNVNGTMEILWSILPVLSETACSLEVEDELSRSAISDEGVAVMLAKCSGAPLKRLALTKCDMGKVQPWTLALLAQFNQLEKIEFDGCTFSISESLLIRSLSTSFSTLTNIDLKESKLITDKFVRAAARSCPNLESFILYRCKLVSTLAVFALIESAFFRSRHMLVVNMQGTAFSSAELSKYMASPLFAQRGAWRLSPAAIELGYTKPAVLVEHRDARCVLVYV